MNPITIQDLRTLGNLETRARIHWLRRVASDMANGKWMQAYWRLDELLDMRCITPDDHLYWMVLIKSGTKPWH